MLAIGLHDSDFVATRISDMKAAPAWKRENRRHKSGSCRQCSVERGFQISDLDDWQGGL
jgi:hypothetical protein